MSTIKTLNVKVNGLNPNQKYKFNITNNGGNWPVRVSPVSGVFYPDHVKAYVYFCSTTGECPPTDSSVFYNTPASDLTVPGLAVDNLSLYSVLQLSVTEFDCDDVIFTHPCVVECDECIPNLDIQVNSLNLDANGGYSSVVNASINGMIPNQQYKYEFSGAGGSWPVKILPRTGIISSSTSQSTINSLLTVCSSTGVCPPTDSDVLNSTTKYNISDTLYSLIELSLDPIDNLNTNYQSKTKNLFSVQCDDCLKDVGILNSQGPEVTIISSTENPYELNSTITDLIPGETYRYTVNHVKSNWPCVVSKRSGEFIAISSNKLLKTNIGFCYPSGSCNPNNADVFANYSNDGFGGTANKKYITLNLSVEPVSHPAAKLHSDDFTLLCEGCLPMSTLNVRFVDTPAISLSGCACSETQLAMVSVTGAVPSTSYAYTFSSSSDKVVLNPLSGTTSFGASGSGLVMTVMNLSLASGDQSVVQFKLKDHTNNVEAGDQLAIQCVRNEASCDLVEPLYASFADGPSMMLSDDCACSGTRLMSVNVSGVMPNTTYSYMFDSTSPNITFNPVSGTTLFGPANTGTVMSLFNLALASGDQSIVQFKITDNTNGIEAINYLPIQCSGSCI